jgi:hypothetical protein
MPPVEAGLLATVAVPVHQALVVASDGPVALKNRVIKLPLELPLGISRSVKCRLFSRGIKPDSFSLGILDSFSNLSLAGSVAAAQDLIVLAAPLQARYRLSFPSSPPSSLPTPSSLRSEAPSQLISPKETSENKSISLPPDDRKRDAEVATGVSACKVVKRTGARKEVAAVVVG